MASSGESKSLHVPKLGIPRKLSLPSVRRWTAQTPEGGSSGLGSSAYPATSQSSTSPASYNSAPLPHFLKKSKTDVYDAWVDLEWQQRDRLVQGLQKPDSSPFARTHGAGNPQIRNRYANVEPFQRNRIKLKVPEGGNDYINASPIVLPNRRFISTQGPKESSVSHFYRMLADETGSLAVVVMLTQTHEAGREKCFAYWPWQQSGPRTTMRLYPDAEDQEDEFEGDVTLLSTTEDHTAKCTIRRMRLRTRTRSRNEPRDPPWKEKEVIHLLFGGWPDFGIPEGDDREALLELIRLSRKLNESATPPSDLIPPPSTTVTELNPRIIHCSAGVGRTGTFIALDHLLTLLDAGQLDSSAEPSSDPIVETVDRLRQQRMMMVQGENQFMFLYDVLREQWLLRWRARQP